LGPTCWLVAFTAITWIMRSENPTIAQYVFADDSSYGSDNKENVDKAAVTMKKACDASGLRLDVNKRTDTVFKRIGAGEQTSAKVTGIFLDSHLSMKVHSKEKVKQARSRIAQVIRAKAFLDDNRTSTVYKSFILPCLEVGSPVVEVIGTDAEKSRLDKVHANFCETFSIRIDPLHLRRKVSLYCLIFKASVLKKGPLPLQKRWALSSSSSSSSVSNPSLSATSSSSTSLSAASSSDTRRSARIASQQNPWPVNISTTARDYVMPRRYAKAIESYNLLPASLFVNNVNNPVSLDVFKKRTAEYLRQQLSNL
jgi:hypothetical protein